MEKKKLLKPTVGCNEEKIIPWKTKWSSRDTFLPKDFSFSPSFFIFLIRRYPKRYPLEKTFLNSIHLSIYFICIIIVIIQYSETSYMGDSFRKETLCQNVQFHKSYKWKHHLTHIYRVKKRKMSALLSQLL